MEIEEDVGEDRREKNKTKQGLKTPNPNSCHFIDELSDLT